MVETLPVLHPANRRVPNGVSRTRTKRFQISTCMPPFRLRGVRIFLILGFLSSVVAIYLSNPRALSPTGTILVAYKGPAFYVAHCLELLFMLSAGIIALATLPSRLRRSLLPMLALYLLAAAWIFHSYTREELFSSNIVSVSGYLPCLMSVLIAFGYEPRNRRFLSLLIEWTSFFFTVLLILATARHPFHTRGEAYANLNGYLTALFLPATLVLLKPFDPRRWLIGYARFLPITLYGIASLLEQTRLNLVLLVPVLILYIWVQARSGRAKLAFVVSAAALLLPMLTLLCLQATNAGESLVWSVIGLQHRLTEDTRSEQIVAYFEDMSPRDILMGRGWNATYAWNGYNWHSGIDVGYLCLILYYGLPCALFYFLLHIRPAFRAWQQPVDQFQMSCAACVLLWGLRMFSTAYPDYNPGYYVFLMCVGVCLRMPVAKRSVHAPHRLKRKVAASKGQLCPQ